MLKNIKSNLSSSNVIKKDDLDTKIYITVKSFLLTYKEYNNFFQSNQLEFEISHKISMKIQQNVNVSLMFFDEESNHICTYSHEKKVLMFEKYYQTSEIEKKMSKFLLLKIPLLANNLKAQMNEEIQRRQNKLLNILDEKEELETKKEETPIKEQKVEKTPIPTPTNTKTQELLIDDDFIIIS